MDFVNALRRYRRDRFTDEDIVRCTGLTGRAWRELIKLGAVRTVTQRRGPGRIRLCDATTFKRASLIATLNKSGISLPVSGQIAYFLPFHTLLYEICDPARIALEGSANVNPQTGLPPRVKHRKVDWFDLDKPAKTDPKSDWLIEIYEARFVGVKYAAKNAPAIFGDLRETGTSFVAWFPNDARVRFTRSVIAELAQERLPSGARLIDFVMEWEDPTPWSKDLRILGYKYEKHGRDQDPLHLAAEAAALNPAVKTTINVSLAIKKALRLYLDAASIVPNSEVKEFK
jgi:hypothetical protein